MATLRINTGFVRPVFEQDWMGQVVPPGLARNQPFEVMCELEMPKRKLAFLVVVSVPLSITHDESRARAMALAWLNKELPLQFAQRQGWDFFTPARLALTTAVEGDPGDGQFFCEVELPARMTEMADSACEFITTTEAEFDKARAALSKLVTYNTAYGFQTTVGEARRHFQVITAVLDANASPFEDFDTGAARSAMGDYLDLAQRKSENSHGYRTALTSLQRFVFGASFPVIWGRRPQV